MQSTQYLYRPVLAKALSLVWRNKILWIFGLFAVFLSTGGEYEIISRGLTGGNESILSAFVSTFFTDLFSELAKTGGNVFSSFWEILTTAPAEALLTATVFLAFLSFFLVMFWLAIVSEISIIKQVSILNKNRRITVRESIEFSNRNFWPVVAITVAQKVILFGLFALFGVVMWLSSGSAWLPMTISIFSFAIFSIAVLVVSFILKYQIFYVILKGQDLKSALGSAWQLFLKNWLISLELALILFGAYLVTAYVNIFLLALFSAIPIVIVPFYLGALAGAFKIVIAAMAALAAAISICFVAGWVSALQWATWTILFSRLDGGEELSKLSRVAADIKQWPAMIMRNNQN